MRLLLILLLGQLFLLNPAFGAKTDADFESVHIYMAAGQNFYFPSSIRVGWGGWEGGTLSSGFVGLNKIFPLSGSSAYSSFGFGVNVDGFSSNLGFRSGVGVNYKMIWELGLRMEMFALANFNGQFTSHGLLGLSYVF